MIPTAEQVEKYFGRLESNYTDLLILLTDARANLNTIFGATDKPIPKGESLGALVLEAALGLALPQGKAFYSFVNNMVEGAKLMKAKAEEMRRYQNIVDKAIQETTQTASRVSTAYHNGAMGMIPIIDSTSNELFSQKALNIKLGEVFKSLRGEKTAEPIFNSIEWTNPPALVADNASEIRYIFTYILTRLAVFLFVRLNVHRQNNPFDLKYTQLLVTKIEPEGISEAGCDYIFKNFNRSFPDSKNSKAELPASNIVAIGNYYDMINNWYPDIYISTGSHEELVKIMGLPQRERRHITTRMLTISNGFKAIIPEVLATKEFRESILDPGARGA